MNNQSHRNLRDGFLVLGMENYLEGNNAQFNGERGIHVASTVPITGKERFLKALRLRAQGNSIVGNTALNNKLRDLHEFTEEAGATCEDNHWGHQADGRAYPNTFKTAKPACVR